MLNDGYKDSRMYEIFIRRAHKSGRTPRNGADATAMQTLINLENGTVRTGNHDKQLTKVKGYFEKAIDKFLKMKPTEHEEAGLNQLRSDLQRAYTSAQLMGIVNRGLELTQRFKGD